MPIPEKLPIAQMEDYPTEHMGTCSDGRLFWGYETCVFTKLPEEQTADDWTKYRKEYVVLHIFSTEGKLQETKHSFVGLTSEIQGDSTHDKLLEMVSGLGDVEYEDIEVELFQTTIDGVIFGLIPDVTTENIVLQPGSLISFQEPWDGEYYT